MWFLPTYSRFPSVQYDILVLGEIRASVLRTAARNTHLAACVSLLAPAYQTTQASPKYTTPSSQRVSGWVTVIHPHHPLYGQQVEIIRIRRGADPDLIIRHLDGYHGAIA